MLITKKNLRGVFSVLIFNCILTFIFNLNHRKVKLIKNISCLLDISHPLKKTYKQNDTYV